MTLSGWWFGTCFSYTGNNHPNWLSYFSEGLKPPTQLSFRTSSSWTGLRGTRHSGWAFADKPWGHFAGVLEGKYPTAVVQRVELTASSGAFAGWCRRGRRMLTWGIQTVVLTVRQFKISFKMCSRFKPQVARLPRSWPMDPWLLGAIQMMLVIVLKFKISSGMCSKWKAVCMWKQKVQWPTLAPQILAKDVPSAILNMLELLSWTWRWQHPYGQGCSQFDVHDNNSNIFNICY